MELLLMMYKVKYFKSINDNVNSYCLKILQEKHPLINNFSIENITKEKCIDCDICNNNIESSMGYNNDIQNGIENNPITPRKINKKKIIFEKRSITQESRNINVTLNKIDSKTKKEMFVKYLRNYNLLLKKQKD